jgi:hypothetical protein
LYCFVISQAITYIRNKYYDIIAPLVTKKIKKRLATIGFVSEVATTEMPMKLGYMGIASMLSSECHCCCRYGKKGHAIVKHDFDTIECHQ